MSLQPRQDMEEDWPQTATEKGSKKSEAPTTTEANSTPQSSDITDKNKDESNRRLFVGNLPKIKSRDELRNEAITSLPGVINIISHGSTEPLTKNRGFCFIDFDSYENATFALKNLRVDGFCGNKIVANWADPQIEPDPEEMKRVRTLFIRELASDVTDQELLALFSAYGVVERVKRVKGYGFVKYADRVSALRAMNFLKGASLRGVPLELHLARPPTDKATKQRMARDRLLRNAEATNTQAALQIQKDLEKQSAQLSAHVFKLKSAISKFEKLLKTSKSLSRASSTHNPKTLKAAKKVLTTSQSLIQSGIAIELTHPTAETSKAD